MQCFFITGTDTDIGKTTMACALLQLAQQAGLATLGVKPIAAGCVFEKGHWVNDDALQLQEASSYPIAYQDVNPIALEPAIAPHIAAQQAGIEVTLDALVAHCRQLKQLPVDFLLIEGAGGWLVPLNETHTLADLCVALDLPVILVVGMRLGCINHALLTEQAIHQAGLPLAGWIANRTDPQMEVFEENLETLRQRLPAPCLGSVSYAPDEPAKTAMAQLQLKTLTHARL